MHAIVTDAAEGRLPPWAVAGDERRRHMERVADLLGTWSETLEMSPDDRVRWRSAGHLHDVLRDADPTELRGRVPPDRSGLPGPILHGPAAAERLRTAGVVDGELLAAVAWHTVGHPDLGPLGRAVYAADFLEPGRPFLPEWRAALRERMPSDIDSVVGEILKVRIEHLLGRGSRVLPQTIAFWNAVVGGVR